MGGVLVIVGIILSIAGNLLAAQLQETILRDYPWLPGVVVVICGIIILVVTLIQIYTAPETASPDSGTNQPQKFHISQNSQSGNNTNTQFAPVINQPTGPVNITWNGSTTPENQKENSINESNLPEYVVQALKNINSYDGGERGKAIKILGEVSPHFDEAMQGLLQALQHRLPDTKVRAAIELAKHGKKEAIPVLQETLLGIDEDFWKESADGLAAIGPESISTLETIINTRSNKQWIYQLVINALTTIDTPESIQVIIAALENKNFRAYAIEKLGELKDPRAIPALTKLLGVSDGTGGSVAAVLVKIGPDSIPSARKVLEEVKSNRETEKLIAARNAAYILGALGYFNDPAAVLVLIEALSDSEHSISQEARIALEKIGERRWKLTNSLETRLQFTNIHKCGAQEIELVGELIKHLNQHFEVNGINATDSVSWSIFTALEQLGCEKVIKGFVKAQSNSDERLQSLATDTLKGLGII